MDKAFDGVPEPSPARGRNVGLVIGAVVLVLFLLLPPPASISVPAFRLLGVVILMAVWWVSEAIPIPATALVPLVVFPLASICSGKETAKAYMDKNIFLFMGGFFVAMAMRRWELHRRIALHVISILGVSADMIILGFMVATAGLSMWISNTATTMMMVPIAMALVSGVPPEVVKGGEFRRFQLALMLGIAYAAGIGGLGTLIGTPPNVVFAGSVSALVPGAPEVSFLDWAKVGLPVVGVFLPIVWLYLARVVGRASNVDIGISRSTVREELKRIGPMSRGETVTLWVFVGMALGWIFRKNIGIGGFTVPGWSSLAGLEKWVDDSTVAMIAAMVLFVFPVDLKKRVFALDWEWARRIPWGILILFGGGFALAHGFQVTGLAAWIGNRLQVLRSVPVVVLVASTCFLLTFLTEVTSNTATATMMMPILASTAVGIGVHPFVLMIPGTISASCAFMLPVATPPNAIVFGSGWVTLPTMARVGFWMNLLGIVVVTTMTFAIAGPVFGF